MAWVAFFAVWPIFAISKGSLWMRIHSAGSRWSRTSKHRPITATGPPSVGTTSRSSASTSPWIPEPKQETACPPKRAITSGSIWPSIAPYWIRTSPPGAKTPSIASGDTVQRSPTETAPPFGGRNSRSEQSWSSRPRSSSEIGVPASPPSSSSSRTEAEVPPCTNSTPRPWRVEPATARPSGFGAPSR